MIRFLSMPCVLVSLMVVGLLTGGLKANTPPVADAGPDQVVDNWHGDGSERVAFDGSGSADGDGTIASYAWSVGASVVGTGETSDAEMSVGTHTVTLTVTDDGGLTDTDTVQITVRAIADVDAGPDQHLTDADADGSEPVTLDGSHSSVAGGTITSYTWKRRTEVLGTGPTINVTLEAGWHSITLECTDSLGRTEYDVVNVLISEPFTADWYVDANNGSDTTGDGSQGNPFQTIAKVMTVVAEGEVVALEDGNYGTFGVYEETGWQADPPDVFTDWVTFRAANGAKPVLDWIRMGARTGGSYEAYLAFEGLTINDGVRLQRAGHVSLKHCRIARLGPHVGTKDNIEKEAVEIWTGQHITIEGCEITDTATGVFAAGDVIEVLDSHIHKGTHDGIRPWDMDDSLIAGNDIHDFDDGVTDEEASDDPGAPWGRHSDLIHIAIRGPGNPGWGCENLTIRGNRLWNVESQSIQINGYYASDEIHHNLVFENNVFGPSRANMANLVEDVDGLVFRNNTVCDVGAPVQFHRWTLDNYTLRIGNLQNVRVYNNVLKRVGVGDSTDMRFFDYNLIAEPSTLVVGVDDQRGYGRFTILEGNVGLADAEAFDGEFGGGSDAINTGTRLFAHTPIHASDYLGTARDDRPDMGAWEMPGLTPPAETLPPVFNDTKTIFVDDFEDGHYNDVDPWLAGQFTQGMSWFRPAAFDTHKYFVTYAGGGTLVQRNRIKMPVGDTVNGREAWLLSEQGDDWFDYTFEFDCVNAFLPVGAGVVVLAVDSSNAYFIDLTRDSGRIIRIMDGNETTLLTDADIEMPHSGERSYKVTLDVQPGGITIEVDADADGSIDATVTDTDGDALSTFTSGGVGFRCDNFNKWHNLQFDNIRIEVSDFLAPAPLIGDADGDGDVDAFDLTAVANNFGDTGAPGIPGDADHDGDVDAFDLTAVANNFGKTGAPAPSGGS